MRMFKAYDRRAFLRERARPRGQEQRTSSFIAFAISICTFVISR